MQTHAEEIAQADREYHPCRNGLHVCGQICDEDGERPLTLANVPGVARSKFQALAVKFGIPHDESDLVIDFMVQGDIIEDFSMRRQDLDALIRSCKE
jgi:hypothetical protein